MKLAASLALVALTILATSSFAAQESAGGKIVVYGDTANFYGMGKPNNCILNNRFKHGDPVGFRATAINPVTGKRDRSTQLVVHLSYAGKTVDIPMRDRQTAKEPEREFWVAKWMVPADAPVGIVRYTITAKDAEGRMGVYKPFEVETSQITIVE
ncbi:MAG: hypothetical protein HY824_07040 [Acidobacteria bacterium]|nr:hypothetical protein [Acidobacteriota bacterium]